MVHAAAYCSGSFTVMLTSTTIGFRCALSRFGSRLLMQQALSQLSQTQLQQVFRTNGPPQQQDPESHGRTTLSTMEARQGRAQQQYKQPSPSRLGYLMLQHGMSHIGCAPRGAHQQAAHQQRGSWLLLFEKQNSLQSSAQRRRRRMEGFNCIFGKYLLWPGRSLCALPVLGDSKPGPK